MIITHTVWQPHTVAPIPGLVARIAVDNGPDTDPDDFRVYLLDDLYEYRVDVLGHGAFVDPGTDKPIAYSAYFWTPFEDLLIDLEAAIEMKAAI